jgi:Rhodopirellula transposase DDE domain
MIDEDPLRDRQSTLLPHLDERQRRLFASSEAKAAGHGGIAAVSRVTGIARSTIGRGLKDIADPASLPGSRVRRPGGGRKSRVEENPQLLPALLGLVEPDERGDPMSPLRWTCKSTRRLAAALGDLGHVVSHTVVAELLKAEKFSLRGNRKTLEGADHPDRDAQFQTVNAATKLAFAEQQPVISVDTKKRNWSATSRTPAGNGAPQVIPRTCGCTTSSSRNSAAPSPMAFMTSPPTPVG